MRVQGRGRNTELVGDTGKEIMPGKKKRRQRERYREIEGKNPKE